jgi:predicted RNA-binding Zn-ribbon protein involved in translation (DUF1610 family)
MDASMSISKKFLRTVDKVGVSQRQNLEWLIDFAESEADTPTMREECLYFISRVTNRAMKSSSVLPVPSLQSLRSTVRQALVDRATGKEATIAIDVEVPDRERPEGRDSGHRETAQIAVILSGDRKSYEIPGRNGIAAFLFAVTDLLYELRAEIALCAYQGCTRGSFGVRRRLFLRNRRARYCCRTCANNATSDAFLAKPENRKRRLEQRKLRFIFTCPNCKTELPIAKRAVDVECPNCAKVNLSGSLNTREKQKAVKKHG